MRNGPNLPLAALFLAGLAGCGQSAPGEKGASAAAGEDPTAEALEMAFRFQPGQYRTTIAIHKVEIPGMPPGVGEQMKGAMGKAINREYCLSAEQAAKGVEAMKEHLGEGKCQFESFNARGGKVDSVFSCQTGPDMILRSASQGTYTDTGSKVLTKAEMKGPGGKMVQIEQTVTTERIGNCG